MNGKFIVVEGLEGAGKTTATTQIKKFLHQQNIQNIVSTYEPGGTYLGEKLRVLIKEKKVNNKTISDYAELLMIYAARSQSIEEVIKPALAKGFWVISDRHDLSSLAYQGGGRSINNSLLESLRNNILGSFRPDLTIYLDIPPLIGLNRIINRNTLDRIEMEPLEFFERTRSRYQALASIDNNIITINANKSLSTVKLTICNKLMQWIQTLKI